jgi:hypothetical protein
MLTEKNILQKLERKIKEIFEATDFIKITDIKIEDRLSFAKQGVRPDLIVKVKTNDRGKYSLIFEVKSAGQPRYTRMAASQLKAIIGNRKNYYGVFAATFISDESKQICRENDIGYIDLAGNCYFKFDNVYIMNEGLSNPYPNTRPLKSIFSTKSTRALRVLLCNPQKKWFVKDLSKEANLSLGQTFNIKQRLLEFEFIEETGSGKDLKFRLKNPEQLLMKWSNNYNYKKNKIRNFFTLTNERVLEEKLIKYFKKRRISYAFTLTSGASRIAPFLRYKTVFAYVMDDFNRLTKDLNLKEVTSGPNISFLEPYDEGVLYGQQEIKGAKVVSNVQLYLDLKSYKERGEEAAEFLLEQRLRKKW